MSITVTTAPESQQSDSDAHDQPASITDPLDWFEREIIHDPAVCSHCFAEVRRVHCDLDDWGDEQVSHERTETATMAYDLETPPETASSVQPLARLRTACLDCGSVGCRATDEALDRRELLQRVPTLTTRLQERGYDVRGVVLREAVRTAHQKRALAGDSTRLLAIASKVAVEH